MAKTTPKTKTTEPAAQGLQEFCAVCDRVRWGNFQVLGNGLWRHSECYAGSKQWLEVQRLKPIAQRSKLFPFFALSNSQVGGSQE